MFVRVAQDIDLALLGAHADLAVGKPVLLLVRDLVCQLPMGLELAWAMRRRIRLDDKVELVGLKDGESADVHWQVYAW